MNKEEAVKQLKDLKAHCQCYSPEPPWNKDVEALELAISELKKDAPERPIQIQERKLQSYYKKIRIALITIIVFSLITSAINIYTTYQYRQSINKENTFFQYSEKILQHIEKMIPN